MTHNSGDDDQTTTPDGGTPDNGLEEAMQRLEAAGQAVQQAMRSADRNGPAVMHVAHAVLQVFKYVELLGIQLAEVRDHVGGAKDPGPGAELDVAELGYVDPQGVPLAGTVSTAVRIPLTPTNAARLIHAARQAGVSPVEFATAAILRAVHDAVGPVAP